MKTKATADSAPDKSAQPKARVFKSCDPTWPKWGATPAGWNTQTKWFDSERDARQYAGLPSLRPHDDGCGCYSCLEYDGTIPDQRAQHTPDISAQVSAQLISAAPDLLAALKELVYRNELMLDYARQGEIETRWTDKQSISPADSIANYEILSQAVQSAKSVIAKAEGRTT